MIDFELVLSEFILDEVERGLKKPYFAKRHTPETAANFLRALRQLATIVAISGAIHGVVSDQNDDPIIDTAVSGHVEYLVSGDKQVRAVGTYEGVKIVTPREFLDLVHGDS